MEQQHFLLVVISAQGHLNPARDLARRLVRIAGARVTISAGISAHRKLFPSSVGINQQVEDGDEGLISYFPYCDEVNSSNAETTDYFSRLKLSGSDSLGSIVSSLAASSRPVTCIIYTILLSWAADVARDFGIPSVPFWVQPATLYSIFHHYFHGASDLISANKDNPLFPVELPGLPPLRIRDLPSVLVSEMSKGIESSLIVSACEEMFCIIDREVTAAAERSKLKPMVLVNTFDCLEPNALSSVDNVKLVAVGPTVDHDEASRNNSLFEDDSGGYMEWLDSKEEKSVVYVSFGSVAAISKRQSEEILQGLEGSGRPYLWVVRKDAREKEEGIEFVRSETGLVIEWCNQVRVLSHRSVGCFVTHCGWNSTVESINYGMPMVLLPQWGDQLTNAWLVEEAWGTGVRLQANEDRLAEGRELERCLELVMGEEGVEIRNKAEMWKDRARQALEVGGSSDQNLKAFVEEIKIFASSIIKNETS